MADVEDPLFVVDDEFSDVEEMDDDQYANSQIYNEDSERLPKAPAYDSDFPIAQKTIAEIIEGFEATIPYELREAPRFKHLYDSVTRLKTLQKVPHRHRINIVGKSGAGKSSLLNSILGRPKLAKSLAASKACTHVPTSYESRFQGQKEAMAAKIEFFTTEEMRTKIDLMLKDYNAWVHEEQEEDMIAEETTELRTAAATAFDAFRSLFCEQDEFSSKKAGEEFLERSYGKDRKAVVQQLLDWCEELIEEVKEDDVGDSSSVSDISDSSAFREFDNQDNLTKFIEPFAFSDSKHSKPGLWPIVKIIRLGLGGIKLLQTNTITDWPGSDDTNRIRAKAAAERIYHCDEIWIVSSADRIGTDPSATTNLVRYGNDVPCTVICTCIDEKLDEGLAQEMEKDGEDIGNHDDLLEKEKKLAEKIRSTETKIKTRDAAIRDGYFKRIGSRKRGPALEPEKVQQLVQEMPKLRSDLEFAQDEHQDVVQERFDLLITIRKSYIQNVLKETVSRHLDNSRQIKLFCVSNLHYNMHKTGRTISGPHLSVQATGIPEVRQYLFESAAPRILQNTKQFINTQLSVLLNGANVVANPESFKGGAQVKSMIEAKCSQLQPCFTQYVEAVKTLAKCELQDPLAAEQKFITSGSLKRLNEKRAWHWCSIRAFARREGCHKTPSQPQQSWNEQFTEESTSILTGEKNNGRWKTFEIEEKSYARQLNACLVDECEDIASKLLADTAGFRLPKQEFRQFMEGQILKVGVSFENFKVRLAKSLM